MLSFDRSSSSRQWASGHCHRQQRIGACHRRLWKMTDNLLSWWSLWHSVRWLWGWLDLASPRFECGRCLRFCPGLLLGLLRLWSCLDELQVTWFLIKKNYLVLNVGFNCFFCCLPWHRLCGLCSDVGNALLSWKEWRWRLWSKWSRPLVVGRGLSDSPCLRINEHLLKIFIKSDYLNKFKESLNNIQNTFKLFDTTLTKKRFKKL